MSGVQEPTRRAAEAQTPPDSSVVPLGTVKVCQNGNSLTVSLPHETAIGYGFLSGTNLQVGYDTDTGRWLFELAEDFDGWE